MPDVSPPDPDPFAPLPGAPNGQAANGEDKHPVELWEPQLPAPEEPPEAKYIRHPEYGAAVKRWVYCDADGRLSFIVVRFEKRGPNGELRKETLPYTYGRRVWTKAGRTHDRRGWHFKRPAAPVPLYGLDRLAARPDAPVLVVEGEKTADAAGLLFPGHVAITSQGGSKAVHKADWSPLAGRDVTIWPDRDAAGEAYAQAVADLAAAVGAGPVRIVDVPADWPEGWDLADPPPDGASLETLTAMLAEASAADAPPVLPPRYRLDGRGLFFQPWPTERNPNPDWMFVSAPFTVVGETNDGAGQAWGTHLRWRDRDNRSHQWAVPKRMVHADGNAIAAELENLGLQCSPTRAAHDALKGFIGGVRSPRRLRCVDRIGWHSTDKGQVFVLPGGEAFGPGAAEVILQGEGAGNDEAFRPAGTLADWQREVAAYAVGNDRVALFVSAAFAGPLLDVTAEPSGGVHLVGKSRDGKSSTIYAAASVWGRGDEHGQVGTWRGTVNGLEGTAAERSDTVLILDELGQAEAREAGDAVYMLANQSGKARAARGGEARRRRTWRCLLLSTGEVTLGGKMAEAGRRAMAGLDVRLVSLPADAGAGMGAFQVLHGVPNPAALADQFRQAARTSYGRAGRAYLARLVRDRATDPESLRAFLSKLRAAFLRDNVPPDADGQVQSVAGRFALIGAAGELARDYGVLPWPEGEAMRAAGACFRAWLDARGGAGAGEDAQAIKQVRAFIEAHGESRFTALGSEDNEGFAAPADARTINRAGFRRRLGHGETERWEYMVLKEAWAEVCRGLDPARAAKALDVAGFLVRDDDRHLTSKRMLPALGRPRVYVISANLLGGSDA